MDATEFYEQYKGRAVKIRAGINKGMLGVIGGISTAELKGLVSIINEHGEYWYYAHNLEVLPLMQDKVNPLPLPE